MDLFSLEAYQYNLPEELIAQFPCTPRDSSRLMLIEKSTGNISEIVFRDLIYFLKPGDRLVFNDTKVIPARLFGKKETGGNCEIFLVKQLTGKEWEVLARPGKKLKSGTIVTFSPELSCEILDTLPNGNKIVRFIFDGVFESLLEKHGRMPLPQYIKREDNELDEDRYQTIYACNPGALAAPTAGLHFTKDMLETLALEGVKQTKVTLHVGLGTFRPVQVTDIRQHEMHSENFIISENAAKELNEPTDHKIVCVGTTSCRSLETAANDKGKIQPGVFDTNIFIHPGYQFKYTRSLLTNFHLPGSTLLMLVCAFAGYDLAMEAYQKAIKDKFRFYSYGDAMLIY